MEQEKEKREKSEQEKWVYDGSVDSKGRVRVPLHASTGGWIASLFVLSKIST
jgi:hypothetical protein